MGEIMILDISDDDVRIKWENKNEKDYVMEKLDQIHFVYDPVYVTYVNGKLIKSKAYKEK